ncbi:MAG: MBL fold metallo-hydrolase [Candidatus Nitrosopolaris sp.]
MDTCYIKELPKLESYLKSISYRMSDIKRIILTHAHADHVQAANEVNKRTYVSSGYVKLRLDLSSINNPREYGVLFYTAESFKSNEVRDFTSWVAIPPSPIKVSTSPDNIVIRQGEQQLIPAEIKTIFSNKVTSITFDKDLNEGGSDFNSSGLHVSTQRIQSPLFNVEASPQTPVGIYTVPFTASIMVQTMATSTKPIFDSTVSGFVVSKKKCIKKISNSWLYN